MKEIIYVYTTDTYKTKNNEEYIRIIDVDFYLRIKNIELHKYFEKSKNKVEPWRTNTIQRIDSL